MSTRNEPAFLATIGGVLYFARQGLALYGRHKKEEDDETGGIDHR